MKLRLVHVLLSAWLGVWLSLPGLAQGDAGRAPRGGPQGMGAGTANETQARTRPGRQNGGATRNRRAARQAPGSRAGRTDRTQREVRLRKPWRPRRREGVAIEGTADTMWEVLASGPALHGDLNPRALRQLGLRPRGMGLKDLSAWPEEPASRERWNATRFTAAFVELCPAGLGPEVARYARFVLQVSREHGVDPALLAALVYQQSECDAERETSWGFGLTQLNRGLLPAELRDGVYPFVRATESGWEPTEIRLKPTPQTRENLLDPYTNLYLAALNLRVLEQQCPKMDAPYGSRPHRHFVSHFIWGDEVRDAGAEDRVLEARRRLLAYYEGMRKPAYAKVRGVVLVSPVDGAPRIATSGLGDDRDDGKRRHAGIDYLSRFGQPVRAIASGQVVYAGTDLANDRKVNVDPDRSNLVPRTSMGARGLFVEVDHAEGLHSVYAHLASYTVRAGDHVRRGQLLGYVGRSGIRESDPHLHFGLFADGEVLDPLTALQGLVFGPGDTVREPQPHDHDGIGQGRRRRRGRGGGRGRGRRKPRLLPPLQEGPTASATLP